MILPAVPFQKCPLPDDNPKVGRFFIAQNQRQVK